MNTVSIIVPCFNAGNHLNEAVNSALNQSYPATEVIIVDDGSTDEATRHLLDNAPWPRVRILRQTNQGPAAARNAGILTAKGDYILPLDADDRIHSQYVEKAVRVLDANDNVGITYCRAMKFGMENGVWDLPPFSIHEMAIDNVIFVSALFRRADWEKIGGFSEKLKHGMEDYDFWLKILSLGRSVVRLDEFLFYYRILGESRTTRFKRDPAGVVAAYAEIFRSNKDFFAANASTIYEHRFALYRQLDDVRNQVARYKRLVERVPFARAAAKWLADHLSA